MANPFTSAAQSASQAFTQATNPAGQASQPTQPTTPGLVSGAMSQVKPAPTSPAATVEGRVRSIIDTDSPLMQQARTTAMEGMNSRGLVNSSMATGAAQQAVLNAATPIAQQDAQAANAKETAATAQAYNLEQLQTQYGLQKSQVPTTFASNIASTTNDKISSIMSDPDLTPEAKQAAIENVVAGANASLSWAETFYGATMPKINAPSQTLARKTTATPAASVGAETPTQFS